MTPARRTPTPGNPAEPCRTAPRIASHPRAHITPPPEAQRPSDRRGERITVLDDLKGPVDYIIVREGSPR
jgi:hypothetical protein